MAIIALRILRHRFWCHRFNCRRHLDVQTRPIASVQTSRQPLDKETLVPPRALAPHRPLDHPRLTHRDNLPEH